MYVKHIFQVFRYLESLFKDSYIDHIIKYESLIESKIIYFTF